MAKKPRVDTAAGGDLRSNPFASLASSLGDLPPGEPETEVEAAPATQPIAPSKMFGGKLVVRREKKGRGGKVATVVDGLQGTPDELDTLARELRRALGTGAHVEGERVVVGGVHTERLRDHLLGQGARTVVIGN